MTGERASDKRPIDVPAAIARLCHALAAPGQPAVTFEVLDTICAESIGHRLFTVLAWRRGSGDVERVYTSRPSEYPLAGRKPMGPTAWGSHVLKRGLAWRGSAAEDIRWAFPDHALILGLGCESCLNAPVRLDGDVLGVVSVLHGAGWYHEADLDALEALSPLLAAPLLLAAR